MEENEIFVETETYNEQETGMVEYDANVENSDNGILGTLLGIGVAAAGGFILAKVGKPIVNGAKKFGSSFKKAWADMKEPKEEKVEVQTEEVESDNKKTYTYKK